MFCSAPWQHMYIHTDGSVKTCCAGEQIMGNIRQTPIEEILTNEKYTEIKTKIFNGEWPDNCSTCKLNEELSGASQRQQFQNLAIKKVLKNKIDLFDPNFLDIRWNNTCNSSCVYCGPHFSSKWEKLLQVNDKKFNDVSGINNFKNYLEVKKSSIKRLWLIGGEPLLIKDNLELLSNTSDDIQLLLITNLSIPNLEKSPIWRELKNKKNIKWNISFENIGSQYDYVRHGAKWSDVLSNLDLLIKNNSDITIAATYNILCAYQLDSFYEFCHGRNLQIQWSLLTDPVELNVHNFPYSYRLRAYNHIQRIVERYGDTELAKFANTLLENKVDDENILTKFKKFTNNIDNIMSKKVKFDFIFHDFYMH